MVPRDRRGLRLQGRDPGNQGDGAGDREAPRHLLGGCVTFHTSWTTNPDMAVPFNALTFLGSGVGGGKVGSVQGPLQ